MSKVIRLGTRVGHTSGKSVDKSCQDQKQRGRIRMMRILDLEVGRDFAAGLRTEDLFPRDPAMVIHECEPAPQYVQRQIDIPVQDEDQVEALVPQEASWEEWPGWDAGEEFGRSFDFWSGPGPGLGNFCPKI